MTEPYKLNWGNNPLFFRRIGSNRTVGPLPFLLPPCLHAGVMPRSVEHQLWVRLYYGTDLPAAFITLFETVEVQ